MLGLHLSLENPPDNDLVVFFKVDVPEQCLPCAAVPVVITFVVIACHLNNIFLKNVLCIVLLCCCVLCVVDLEISDELLPFFVFLFVLVFRY